MRELVLEPLGMQQSAYAQPLPEPWTAHAASGHPWKGQPLSERWHVYPELAAAGLWTTPRDLALAGIEVQRTLHGESPRLLEQATLIEMLTPGVDPQIGMGFFLSGTGDAIRFGHSGWNEGFVSQMTFYRDHGLGAVIMLNSNEGFALIGEVERAIARAYSWPGYFPSVPPPASLDAAACDRWVGSYRGPQGLICLVTRQGDQLLLQVGSQPPLALTCQSATSMQAQDLNVEVTFAPGEHGDMDRLTLRQQGQAFSFERG
jgi:CubicO group peptidase (beta-lactamase class C family)